MIEYIEVYVEPEAFGGQSVIGVECDYTDNDGKWLVCYRHQVVVAEFDIDSIYGWRMVELTRDCQSM